MNQLYKDSLEAAENEGMPTKSETPSASILPSAETTSLERRVLAHERILQSLIAHMAESEPRFIDRLMTVFSEPMKMARHEQDFIDTDDYAEKFVRAVVDLEQLNRRKVTKARSVPKVSPLNSPKLDAAQSTVILDRGAGVPSTERVQISNRSGIWEVKVDGRFHGDYLQRDEAIKAADLAAHDWKNGATTSDPS